MCSLPKLNCINKRMGDFNIPVGYSQHFGVIPCPQFDSKPHATWIYRQPGVEEKLSNFDINSYTALYSDAVLDCLARKQVGRNRQCEGRTS